MFPAFFVEGNMAKPWARQFYSSKAWQDCREAYMKKAPYLCEDCLARGIYKPAKEVHHIEELTPLNIRIPEVTLGFDNLIALCKECHGSRHDNHGRWHKVNEAKRQAKKESQRFFIDEFGRVSAK